MKNLPKILLFLLLNGVIFTSVCAQNCMKSSFGNYLFFGRENVIYLNETDVNCNSLLLKADGSDSAFVMIIRDSCSWSVKISQKAAASKRKIKLVLYEVSVDKKIKKQLCKTEFLCRGELIPEVCIGKFCGSEIEAKPEDVVHEEIKVQVPASSDVNLKFTVISCEVYFSKNGNMYTYQINGAYLSTELKNRLIKLDSGDHFTIKAIKVKASNGNEGGTGDSEIKIN